MGVWSNFVSFLTGKSGSNVYKIEQSTVDSSTNNSNALDLKLLMLVSAIGYLANGLAVSDWRTIKNGKENFGEEYFRLNNCPNPNQSKSDFCHKLAYKLAIENEAIIVSPGKDASFYVADSFEVEERGTKPNQYKNVLIEGDKTVYSFAAGAVIHVKMNWLGLGGLLMEVAQEYEDMISSAYTGYAKQAGEKGTFKMSAAPSGTKEQQQAYLKSVNDRFAAYFKGTSAVLPLWTGEEYSMNATAHRNTSEINDVINITDEYAERVALAIRVPAGLLKGNVENTEHARQDFIMYGIKPIAAAIEQGYNAKRIGMKGMMAGSYLLIDTIPLQIATATDLATFCDKMIANGQCSVDDLRRARHEPLLGTPEAQKHFITLNYSPIESVVKNAEQEQQEAAEAVTAEADTDQTPEEIPETQGGEKND